jgi:hypothetical protein
VTGSRGEWFLMVVYTIAVNLYCLYCSDGFWIFKAALLKIKSNVKILHAFMKTLILKIANFFSRFATDFLQCLVRENPT